MALTDNPSARSGRKSIVVVLGMHRSGTSTITRALMVLGVELGHRLMPPEENINDRGFFEDVDINAINVALYRSLRSRQRWHSLIPVPTGELLHQKNAVLRLQAIELLKSRLENVEYFGIKDPRPCRSGKVFLTICNLMPFMSLR
jgi:O-antigen biosynthesis protein